MPKLTIWPGLGTQVYGSLSTWRESRLLEENRDGQNYRESSDSAAVISASAMVRLGILTLVCGVVFLWSLVIGIGLMADVAPGTEHVRSLLRASVAFGIFGSPLAWLFGVANINFRE